MHSLLIIQFVEPTHNILNQMLRKCFKCFKCFLPTTAEWLQTLGYYWNSETQSRNPEWTHQQGSHCSKTKVMSSLKTRAHTQQAHSHKYAKCCLQPRAKVTTVNSLNLSSVHDLFSTVCCPGRNKSLHSNNCLKVQHRFYRYCGYLWFTSWGSCHLPHHSHVCLPPPAQSSQSSSFKPSRLKRTFPSL